VVADERPGVGLRKQFGRPATQLRKKEGAYPFAPLSPAPAGCLAGEAVGRFAGNRKKDSRRGGGRKPNPRGVLPGAPTDALSPSPKLGGFRLGPHVWAAQFSTSPVDVGARAW
jgi:hypothetical protein